MDKHDQEVLETGKLRMKTLWPSHKCKSLEQSHPTESPGSQDSFGSGSDSTASPAHHTPTVSTKASKKVSQLWCCSSQSSACSGISTVSGTHTAIPADPIEMTQRTRWPLFLAPCGFTDTLLVPSAPGTHLSAVSDQTLPGQSRHRTPERTRRTKNVYNAQYSGLVCTSAPRFRYLPLLRWGMSSTW